MCKRFSKIISRPLPATQTCRGCVWRRGGGFFTMGAGSIVRERIGVNSSANITPTLSTPTYNRCRVDDTKTLADPARHIHARTNNSHTKSNSQQLQWGQAQHRQPAAASSWELRNRRQVTPLSPADINAIKTTHEAHQDPRRQSLNFC